MSLESLEQRFNRSIFQYRDPAVGLANSGHTMESRYLAAEGILTITALAAGGMAVRGAMSATAPVRAGMTWVRHPIAKYLSVYQAGTRVGTAAKIYLQASKGLRYANYAAFAMNPLATYHYMRNEEYDKAMIQYFGPIGSVWVYNKMTESSKGRTIQPSVVKPARKPETTSKKKPSKMSSEQKKRLWRMGLRWCKRHNRYDRCSLRARKP